MFSSNCAVWGSEKPRFIKEQEDSGVLSSLRIKTPLCEILISDPILFWRNGMNEIVNKFLLAGDQFMPEIHLRQPGFTYSACGAFTKNKQRIQKIKETADSRYIYQSERDKVCF